MTVLVDMAGAREGGARRLVDELDAYLAARGATSVQVVGSGRQLTPDWLLRRERPRQRVECAVALNNVSFVATGRRRSVLLHNALHFLRPDEHDELMPLLPSSFRWKIRMVRAATRRADLVVVPSTTMAERVGSVIPSLRDRLVVRPNPVTVRPVERPPATDRPRFVCPIVISSPFKRMDSRLRLVLAGADRLAADQGTDALVCMTATPDEIEDPAVRAHPRLRLVGRLSTERAAEFIGTASAVLFPTEVESFGYPLAEARLMQVPVVALDNAHNREVAGDALVPYAVPDVPAVAAAMAAALKTAVPAAPPDTFVPDDYFDFLLGGRLVAQR